MLLPRLAMLLILAAAAMGAAGPPREEMRPDFARSDTIVPDTPVGAKFRWLLGVLNGEPAGEPTDHFTDQFLVEVPPAKITKMLRDISEGQENEQGGGFDLVRINAGAAPTGLVAVIEAQESGNQARVDIGVDPRSGKIDFLSVRPEGQGGGDGGGEPDPLESLKKIPGRVSLHAVLLPPADMQDAEPARVLTYQPELTLAIGSTFKLWVLGALADAIRRGDTAWDQPLEIRDALKSLPPGTMQLQPEGAGFPLREFALRMISISDNTAADHLISYLGRDKVETWMAGCVVQPRLNQPLLTTREMFTLKIPGDPNLPLRWNVASERSRRRLLAENGAIARAEPNVAALPLWKNPIQVENIQWFAATPDLCKTIANLRTLEQLPNMDPLAVAMRTNRGADLDNALWIRVAFMSGSEPGVLNYTWMLDRDDGRCFALSMTWNQEFAPLDEARFHAEALKIIDHLGKFARQPSPD